MITHVKSWATRHRMSVSPRHSIKHKWYKVPSVKFFSSPRGRRSPATRVLSQTLDWDYTLVANLNLKFANHIQNEKRRDIYSKDEKIVQDLAENLRIENELFTINKEKKNRNYYKKLRQVVSSNHSYALSKYFQDNIRYKNGLHIKSTIQSIAKASFEKELYESNDFNTLVNGSKRWAKKELIKGEDGLSLIDSVSEFMKRTDLTLNNIYDYHILDILFMESRLGNFQSIITQETDNTLEVFNY